MKKTNPLIASFLILLFLNSCGTIAEGLGGSKKKGSDEFLVEKKSPLVLPPSFGELPEPGKEPEENIISDKKDTSDIEDIINQSSSISISEKSDYTKNSIEQSIIKKINEKKEENFERSKARFWSNFCIGWHPFGPLLVSLGSCWSYFGSMLNCLRSLFALFGSLLGPKSLKELFGTLSAKHPKTIPHTLAFAPHRPYGPRAEPCRQQIRSAPGPKAPRAC